MLLQKAVIYFMCSSFSHTLHSASNKTQFINIGEKISAKDLKETIVGWDSTISLRQKLSVVDSPPQRGQGETDVLQMCSSNGP